MELEAFFLTAAEISVVLIGFVTIFLTFVMSGREIGKADRMHSRALLTGAYPLLFVPFVPVAANAYGASEATALLSFHLAGGLASVMIGIVMKGFYSRLEPGRSQGSRLDIHLGVIHTGLGCRGFFLGRRARLCARGQCGGGGDFELPADGNRAVQLCRAVDEAVRLEEPVSGSCGARHSGGGG